MRTLISTILGLLVAYAIAKPVEPVHGPNSNHVKKYIYHDPRSGKYYQYKTEVVICPSYLR